MSPSAYPLAWPQHRPRRKHSERVRGSFVAGGVRINPSTAATRLEDEIRRLGGIYPLLSSNVELRKDGKPRSNQAPPADPGVCVYFQMKGKPYAMACDTYTEVAQNIAAIANHIEATRRIERYGVATAAETLQAFQALPSPPSCWEILGVTPGAGEAAIDAAYRAKARRAHPDSGGTTAQMASLNAARDAAKRAQQ